MRVLPCCIAGGALTGALSMAFGAKLMAPHGRLFVLLIPGAITPVLLYLVAIAAGTLLAGVAYALLKRAETSVAAAAQLTSVSPKRAALGCAFLFVVEAVSTIYPWPKATTLSKLTARLCSCEQGMTQGDSSVAKKWRSYWHPVSPIGNTR